MAETAARLLAAFIGLAAGISVGSGLVALLVVFDLIPRLAQLARAYHSSPWFESAIIIGAVFWSCADFFDWKLSMKPEFPLIGVGLFGGIFIGMLAAALTEVMNVLPILAKRLNLGKYMVALVMAMVMGKIVGSLFDWLIYQW